MNVIKYLWLPYWTRIFGKEEEAMEGSIYNIIEIVGTSKNSWEEAARNAVETAAKA